MMFTEVLIVGAGPAGSAAALRLARAGREVLLVDRCRFPRPKPCGEYFNPACCRLMRELGVLPEIMAAGARRLDRVVLGVGGEPHLAVPFAGIAPPGDFAFSLGRETVDALLVEAARRAGAVVWEGAMVRQPQREGQTVTGAVIEREGRLLTVPARLTLAADGLRSRFARRLGVGGGDGGRWKLGITARCRVVDGTPEVVEMHAGGPGCCGIVVRGGEANLGMVADGGAARALGGDPGSYFRQQLRAFPRLDSLLDGRPFSIRTVGSLTWTTRRQALSGCLLLGDAAGFYDPFTGQGVTFALLSAGLAAEVSQAALAEGDLSARRLQEYARRRDRLLSPRIEVQKAIQAVIAHPVVLDRLLTRLHLRPAAARSLIGVVADVLPARRILSPGFLAALLLPHFQTSTSPHFPTAERCVTR